MDNSKQNIPDWKKWAEWLKTGGAAEGKQCKTEQTFFSPKPKIEDLNKTYTQTIEEAFEIAKEINGEAFTYTKENVIVTDVDIWEKKAGEKYINISLENEKGEVVYCANFLSFMMDWCVKGEFKRKGE